MNRPYTKKELTRLIAIVGEIRDQAFALEQELADAIAHLPGSRRSSARNLIHYLALRQRDIRPLQESLHRLGLSSLGRLEPYVLPSLDAVLNALRALAGEQLAPAPALPDLSGARRLLERRSRELFGGSQRAPRIMVTLPNEKADHPRLLVELLQAGMDIMRVNCSKGGPEEWQRLIDRLRAAEKETGRSCRILFDLEGPNPRAGAARKKLRLSPGDTLLLKPGDARSKAIKRDPKTGAILRPAQIGVNLEQIFNDVRPGQPVAFDDGKLEGEIESVDENGILVRIAVAHRGAAKLGGGKGINFPGSQLNLPALTPKDLRDLDFVAARADMVGLSFARCPEDVERLHEELAARRCKLGLVLKVETREAFEALPRLLLAAMRRPPVGVMIARGDMGAELGFARMAEVQEEILWLCEAAGVPAIWATQVLESLAKEGVPTRGETTDAALSVRAECVMLNKGAHVVETVEFLNGLLERMSRHQRKKWSLLRKLNVASLELSPTAEG